MESRRFTKLNEGFTCQNCGKEVLPLKNGSCRNHCPFCLYSLHVDVNPGDRAETCLGLMKPVGYQQDGIDGVKIVHECQICKVQRRNKVALDDPVQADDYDLILSYRIMA